MNAQALGQLADDRAEVTRLQAGRRGERAVMSQPLACLVHMSRGASSLSVHRVADPDDWMPRFLDSFDMSC